MRAIDRADVALLLIDAQEGVTAQDMHVAGYVLEANKSAVVLINKWDAIEKDSQTMVEYAKDRARGSLQVHGLRPGTLHQRQDAAARQQGAAHGIARSSAERAAPSLSTSEVNQVLSDRLRRDPDRRRGRGACCASTTARRSATTRPPS
jgi:GTP-binding protein